MQAHLKSIFDNIQSVKFHDQDYNKILAIQSSEREEVPLDRPVDIQRFDFHSTVQVRAEGSVEIWINNLLLCAREAVHCIIR